MRQASSSKLFGRGVNVAPFNVRYGLLDSDDWVGLARRGVQHVRIGGWIAEPLADWSTCPATTRTQPADEEAAVEAIVRSATDAPDAEAGNAFVNLKRMTAEALAAGLNIVLNPFHQRQLVEVNPATVRWIWSAVLREFTTDAFPVDRVAFEMVNEPANYSHSFVANEPWPAMVAAWVAQVRRTQAQRVLVLPGVQGWRRGRGPAASSMDGLLADLHDGLVPASCAGRCIVTFHYYEPRSFTVRPPSAGSGPVQWSHGALELERNRGRIADDFARVVNATPAGVGVYLGEFGIETSRTFSSISFPRSLSVHL